MAGYIPENLLTAKNKIFERISLSELQSDDGNRHFLLTCSNSFAYPQVTMFDLQAQAEKTLHDMVIDCLQATFDSYNENKALFTKRLSISDRIAYNL